MYNNFTEEARKILMSAKEEMKELKHPYVGSEHLLLAILKDNNEISERLKDFNLDYISLIIFSLIAVFYFVLKKITKKKVGAITLIIFSAI